MGTNKLFDRSRAFRAHFSNLSERWPLIKTTPSPPSPPPLQTKIHRKGKCAKWRLGTQRNISSPSGYVIRKNARWSNVFVNSCWSIAWFFTIGLTVLALLIQLRRNWRASWAPARPAYHNDSVDLGGPSNRRCKGNGLLVFFSEFFESVYLHRGVSDDKCKRRTDD